MVDVVDKKTRSRMMAGIKSGNTRPELMVRTRLHRLGFRYRLHNEKLPGRPDLVLSKHRAVIFINGCFWHCHDCHLFRLPKSRVSFWKRKLGGNLERDRLQIIALEDLGWKVLRIWECSLKGKYRRSTDEVVMTAANWLLYDDKSAEIAGADTSSLVSDVQVEAGAGS